MAVRVAISATCNESNNEEPRMQTPIIKRVLWTLSTAVAALLAGTAQAALQDRDLDGNGVTDAFYDTDLDITWLRDANVNGLMNWQAATSWADSFSIGTYNDWRLPTAGVCDPVFISCTGSEMRQLWSEGLGNSGGALTNTGQFQNLLPAAYWSGTDIYTPEYAVPFSQSNGSHGWASKTAELYAMAVRDGDVPAIPEPGTYALMLIGLGALAAERRRQRV